LVHISPFIWLAIYSQKAILKIHSSKIKWFLLFSRTRIWPKFNKNHPGFYTWFKYIAKNIEGCWKILLSCLACSQI
jgi:hypothetical protein